MKNGGRNFSFSLRNHGFPTWFVMFLGSSRFFFAGKSAVVFPNKSAEIYKVTSMGKGDEGNTF